MDRRRGIIWTRREESYGLEERNHMDRRRESHGQERRNHIDIGIPNSMKEDVF